MRVLVVEDETLIARRLAKALGDSGYAVDSAADGEQADFLAHAGEYDAVVLDLGLPKTDGLTLLRGWRKAGIHCPVLILTARGSWHEKVEGIDSGADDYVAKPFRIEEVLARIRALIRRAAGSGSLELSCGALTLDVAYVTCDARRRTGETDEPRVSRSLLFNASPRAGRLSQRTHRAHLRSGFRPRLESVEVFIARLRRKLGASCIETVRGLGYRVGAA